MSFMWLAVWLIKRRPRVRMFRNWNNWGMRWASAWRLTCSAASVAQLAGAAASARQRR
jgi:hypothetical protein